MKLRVRSTDREVEMAEFDVAAAVRRAEQDAERRREVLIECVVATVPTAILHARTEAWDEGWEAARKGLPKTANPAGPHD